MTQTIANLENPKKIKFNSIEYKRRIITTWNEIAPKYHKRWAKDNIGPFKSTAKLISMAKIRHNYNVLDLACGTGVVTRQILKKVGNGGQVTGIDSSQTAIKIAKKWNNAKSNANFVIADAEHIAFNEQFDVITCQYALFFFPNTNTVLKRVRHCLKKNGTLAVSVHGEKNTVPYFSSILDVVIKFIPDYIPPGAPSLDRFGTKASLRKALAKADFTNIEIKQHNFEYRPGTFSNYWNDYLRYLARPLKEKIYKIPIHQRHSMREQIRKNTLTYTKKSGQIVFPWKVLIATAKKP
jgi:ubiquinone/menaquinone biosynthesis C-methylase UbiE